MTLNIRMLLELILPHCAKTLVPDSCRIYDRVFLFFVWNEEGDDYVTMLGHDKAKKWLKSPRRNSMVVSREISKKSLFHVMWVGNILKTFIYYIPLVFKCHFIATSAIFGKIMNFFKKSDFFFRF